MFKHISATLFLFAVILTMGCADEDSHGLLSEDLGHGYTRKGNKIFFQGKRIDQEGKHDIDRFARVLGYKLRLCHDVDAESFKVLSEEYTKDKNEVYYKWISPGRFWVVHLPGADVESFEVRGFNLARDKKQVWYYGSVIPGLDAATLSVLHDGFVWKDAHSVFYQRDKIIGADPESFQHLASGYYADAKSVYWGQNSIQDADLASFRVLGDSFMAVDQHMVYRSGKPLPNIDPTSCKFIMHDPYGYQIISDKNGVYLNQFKFLHAEQETFNMIDNVTGRDGKYIYIVDTYHVTPLTVYLDHGDLVVETILYDHSTAYPLAVIKAVVLDAQLVDITFSPAPGKSAASPISDLQMRVFHSPGLINLVKTASKQLHLNE